MSSDQGKKSEVPKPFGPSGSLWGLWIACRVAAGLLVIMAFTFAIAMVLVAISWFHADAWFDRRWPWISWPLTIAFDGMAAWWIVRTEVEKRRLRRELPGKITSAAFQCPLCQAPLPGWRGVFETLPAGAVPSPLGQLGTSRGVLPVGLHPMRA